jgi:hypothetical protein
MRGFPWGFDDRTPDEKYADGWESVFGTAPERPAYVHPDTLPSPPPGSIEVTECRTGCTELPSSDPDERRCSGRLSEAQWAADGILRRVRLRAPQDTLGDSMSDKLTVGEVKMLMEAMKANDIGLCEFAGVKLARVPDRATAANQRGATPEQITAVQAQREVEAIQAKSRAAQQERLAAAAARMGGGIVAGPGHQVTKLTEEVYAGAKANPAPDGNGGLA